MQYGCYIGIEGTRISGLLHVSNVSRRYLTSVDEVFQIGDPVRAIVMSMSPGFKNISLSTAELEEYSGQVQEDKVRVFENAKESAKEFQAFVEDYDGGRAAAKADEGEGDEGDDGNAGDDAY